MNFGLRSAKGLFVWGGVITAILKKRKYSFSDFYSLCCALETIYYLSRFGSLEAFGEEVTKEEEEEEVDEVEVDEEEEGGTKPVKPKLSPATFFRLFFLWFNLR